MDVFKTHVIRDKDGWFASTELELDHSRVVEIRTRRIRDTDRLATTASVSTVKDGRRTHRIDFGSGQGDYSRRVLIDIEPRVTEKVVRAQHGTVLAQIESLKHAIAAHYARQDQQSSQAEVAEGAETATAA